MAYPRPAYDPAKTVKRKMMFGPGELEVPILDQPITPLENFKRAYTRTGPMWVPNSLTDFDTHMCQSLTTTSQIGADFGSREERSFKDWFGVEWVFVPIAGGPMLKPGTQFMDDITRWETDVKFPVLSDYNWEEYAADFMKNRYDPTRVLHINIGQGCTERLVALLGGYTDAMIAMAEEPEAVRAFLDKFADFTIEFFDLLYSLYPINMITYHDDWGTERDTFFSEAMMEEMVLEPTKRIVQHIKSKGVAFELHSCGCVGRFLPYMVDMGIDFLQLQRRANDIPALKAKYGDKIGFNTGLEGFERGTEVSREVLMNAIRNTVDIYGPNGGFYTSVTARDPELMWDAVQELYWYSREFYEK